MHHGSTIVHHTWKLTLKENEDFLLCNGSQKSEFRKCQVKMVKTSLPLTMCMWHISDRVNKHLKTVSAIKYFAVLVYGGYFVMKVPIIEIRISSHFDNYFPLIDWCWKVSPAFLSWK